MDKLLDFLDYCYEREINLAVDNVRDIALAYDEDIKVGVVMVTYGKQLVPTTNANTFGYPVLYTDESLSEQYVLDFIESKIKTCNEVATQIYDRFKTFGDSRRNYYSYETPRYGVMKSIDEHKEILKTACNGKLNTNLILPHSIVWGCSFQGRRA